MWMELAAIAKIIGAVTSIASSVSTNSYNNKEYSLQEQSMYQSLTSDYYSQESNLNSLESQKTSAETSVKQEQSDIGSEESYLSRWQAYADTTLNSLNTEGKSQYATLASNWANAETAASEEGHVGGSSSLISNEAKQQVKEYVGDNLKYNTTSGSFGTSYQQTAQDLLAEKKTAVNSISTSQEAISSYQDTLDTLEGSIAKQTNSITNTKKKLDAYYGEGNW